jgi:hypothetical protein
MSRLDKNKENKQFQAIEYVTYWEGGVNSSVLARCIGTSNLTARKHIAKYLEQFPGNLQYNPNSSEKLYVPDDNFKLYTVTNKWKDYLEFTASINTINAKPIYDIFDSTCSAPIQNINNEVFRDVYKAIKRKEQITIQYRSDSRPDGIVKIIQPHALASNGPLWYCRAFCNQEKDFKDFYFGRIKVIILSEPLKTKPPIDHEWETYISLHITANHKLSLSMQNIVLSDYGYLESFRVRVRRAMVEHFLDRQRVSKDIERDDPNEKKLMLLNSAEINQLMN